MRLLATTAFSMGACVLLLGACGARTGLHVPPPEDSGPETFDADVALDTFVDTAVDTAPEPIDVLRPEVKPICDDPSVELVYVVTESNELLSFHPPTATFTKVGNIACPTHGSATPFSMAVDRKGTAYVVFSDGELFQVSVKTASCTKTTFTTSEPGFKTFGMAFASESDGSETLYVAGTGGVSALARIQIPSFTLERIAAITPPASGAELTGTGGGQLFGFWAQPSLGGSAVGAIDKVSGVVVEKSDLVTVEQGSGWAFAFWGGDFYLFTGSGSPGSQVTRFRPSDRSVSVVATYPSIIVGAGVSTCAPL